MIWLELDGRHSPKARGRLNRISLIQRRGQCCQSQRIISASPGISMHSDIPHIMFGSAASG